MLQLQPLLTPIRNLASAHSTQAAAFWVVTALIALLLPSPVAGPLLLARLRSPNKE